MAFFPRALVGSHQDSPLSPFFGLLNELEAFNNNDRHHPGHLKNFQPRFDVKELSGAYELHGELPGIAQNDIEIEFSDPQTITIRGRTEREYTSGTPQAAIEVKNTEAITEGGESDHNSARQASVENEDASVQDSRVADDRVAVPVQETPQARYWVSERSVGEFARSFSFPSRIDQDAVKASLKNGILSVVVPKAKKHESRKITIN